MNPNQMSLTELQQLERECADPKEAAVLLSGELDQSALSHLQTELEAKNFRVAVLNGDQIHTKTELLEDIGKTLGFPGYYGKNWSALNDCLLNPDEWTKPVSEAGIVLFLRDANVLEKGDREAIMTLAEIAGEVQARWLDMGEYFRFCVVLGVTAGTG